jgi:drug/metabolite transporter (DMT)-like permease
MLLAGVAIDLVSREPAAESPPGSGSQRERGSGSEVAAPLRAVVFTAIGGGVAFGVFLTAIARSSPQAGLWPIVMARAVTLLCHLLLAGAQRQSLRLDRATLRIALGGGALDIVANVLYLLSTRGALLSLAATVTSLYPAATVLLASLTLGERIHRRRGIGLVCAAVAVLLITASQ